MDLIKAFSSGSEQYQITVKGDHKKPLFKAADIARILEIANVSDALKDYDEDEKRTLAVAEGSRKVANFLTEIGLYRFILSTQKNKPFVKRFKKWVCQVISEIRATGEYRLTKQIETTEAKLIEFQQEKTAIEARAEEDRKRAEEAEAARKEAEAKAAEEQQRREELERKLQKRTYEPIEKTGHVYVMEMDGGIKVGKTKRDVSSRVKGMQTGNRNSIKILLDFETSNPDLLERTVHYILDRYRSNSNREFFDCDADHIQRVVILAGNTIDTLKSMYQSISADEFITRVNENLAISIQERPLTIPVCRITEPGKIMDLFIKEALEFGDPKAHKTQMKYFWVGYCNWRRGKVVVDMAPNRFFATIRTKLDQRGDERGDVLRRKVRMSGVKNASEGYSGVRVRQDLLCE
ncbi:hypothetical protein HK102_003086 [Quaeritorhiza haematococci]|nr:hypothetical protein HK102_003086 [Quaeritorhiza haematococci]